VGEELLLERAPGDPDVAAGVDESRPHFDERRNQTARAVRDRLAERLGIHAAELGGLTADSCMRALANLNLQLDRIHQLEEQAAIDELTGVLRRGHGMLSLTREVRRAFREPDPRLVVAFVDVDGLKWFNDHEGHAEGDRLLVALATAIVHRLRSHDIVFRYGGDEFVCILPGANLDGIEPIFSAVQETFAETYPGRSFSVGLASLTEGDTPEALLARADANLYSARSAGRGPGDTVRIDLNGA
jgi:diguanylate cyclase (GGDEF)-like protein